MNERDKQEPGLSLDAAVERWTPKEVWQRYRQIAKEEIPLIIPANPNPLSEEARHLRAQIEQILIDKLRRGELIASGLPLPLDADTRRRDISSELWSRLKLDIRRQEASGDGLQIVELRFRTASVAKSERAPAAVEEIELPPNRSAGRPSIMPMIEAEMRRHSGRGLIKRSLRQEAKVLAIWARQQFEDAHVPKPESIARKLGRVYKELKRTKRPDKWGDKL
jgi:hypothetical protein